MLFLAQLSGGTGSDRRPAHARPALRKPSPVWLTATSRWGPRRAPIGLAARQIYAASFVEAIVVKVCGTDRSPIRPLYAAIGATLDGERDILGLWAATGGEGAVFWISALTEMRNRGVRCVLLLACDGLKDCPKLSASA